WARCWAARSATTSAYATRCSLPPPVPSSRACGCCSRPCGACASSRALNKEQNGDGTRASQTRLQPGHELWRLPGARPGAERAETAVQQPQRDAVHHPASDDRVVAEVDLARTARRARAGAARRPAARVQDERTRLAHHGAT